MLQQSFETSRAVAVPHTVGPERLSVLALLDWDHLPHEFCQPDQKFRVSLLAGQDCDRALEILVQLNKAPDILIIDEDFLDPQKLRRTPVPRFAAFNPIFISSRLKVKCGKANLSWRLLGYAKTFCPLNVVSGQFWASLRR